MARRGDRHARRRGGGVPRRPAARVPIQFDSAPRTMAASARQPARHRRRDREAGSRADLPDHRSGARPDPGVRRSSGRTVTRLEPAFADNYPRGPRPAHAAAMEEHGRRARAPVRARHVQLGARRVQPADARSPARVSRRVQRARVRVQPSHRQPRSVRERAPLLRESTARREARPRHHLPQPRRARVALLRRRRSARRCRAGQGEPALLRGRRTILHRPR